jgi:tetratricopeptide (TPR) repeat protein
LLTGTTPFDKQRLRSAAWDEMLRIIREEEPPKPSTRLSTIDTLPSVAANRQTEPGKLSGILRGELDWIVMKALDKDRNRRYETANGLAMDLLRYLHDEPVVACPPSATYRFRKFARRNRAALSTAALLAGALLLGTTISIWQAIRATHAERTASQLLTSEQQAHREAEAAQQQEAEQRRAAELAREQEAAQRQVAQQSQQQAEQERQRAEENFQKANQFNAESVERLTRLYVRRGTESVERSDFTSALPWFLKALDIDRADPQREAIHRLRIATTLDRCPKLTQLIDPGHRVETIDFLPGGRRVLLGGEGKSSVWDLPTGSAVDLQLLGYFCQLSPDGRQIVELAKPGIVRLRDSSSGQVTHELPRVSQRPRVAGFSADSRRLFVIH